MNRFTLILTVLVGFAVGCEDYSRQNIGTLSDLRTSPQSFNVHLPRNQQRWWILLYADNNFNLPNDNIEVFIHNKGENQLTATYANTTSKTITTNAKVSMFYGTFGELLAQSKGMAGISCQSDSGQLNITIEFHHRTGLELNAPIRVVAHTQNTLP